MASTGTLRRRGQLVRDAVPVLGAVVGAVLVSAVAGQVALPLVATALVGLITVGLVRAHVFAAAIVLLLVRATLELWERQTIASVFGVGLSVAEVLGLAFMLGVAWALLAAGDEARRRLLHAPLVVPLALFFLVTGLSLLYSADLAAGARDLLKLASAVAAYLAVVVLRPGVPMLRRLLWAVVVSAIVPLGLAWWQFANSVGSANRFHGGLRVASSFTHPNTFGFYLIGVLVAVWGLRAELRGAALRLVDGVGMASFVTIFLTLSRTAWGGLAALAVVLGWRNRRLIVGMIALVGVVLAAMPRVIERVTDVVSPRAEGGGNSLLQRYENWSRAFDAWLRRPLLGIGWGSSPKVVDSASHNDFLRALVEAGPIGLLSFVWLIAALLLRSFQAARGRMDLPRAFFGLAIGYALVSAAANTQTKAVFQFYFWLLAGVSFVWAERVPPAPRTERTSRAPATAGR